MACAPSTRCAVRWIFHGRGIVSLTGSVGSINAILPNYWDRVSAQFNGVGCTLEKA